MTNREITAVAAKVFAAYLLIMTVIAFPVWVMHMYSRLQNKPAVFCVAGIGVFLGLLCVRAVRRFSHSLRPEENDAADLQISGTQLECILLRCLGLYFGMDAFRDIVNSTILIGRYSNQNRDLFPTHVNLWTAVAVFAIALSFIVKPMKWIEKMRKPRPAAEHEESPTNATT